VTFCPARAHWEPRAPAERGLSAAGLAAAIEYHHAHESRWPRDFLTESGRFIGVADEPAAPGDVLGPVRPRGDPSGLVVRGGFIVAEWGDTRRCEMSFSIAKSYLAILTGLALDRGLIPSLDVPVRDSVDDGGFDGPQNRTITWRHLLQLTSEWTGTLWGKPDSIDHNRDLGKAEFGGSDKGRPRALWPPGALWEYNDVRVNRLSLALLRVFRRPLADVVREAVLDPIGASDEWAWHPYDNAWVEIDGVRMPSVPGGSHWGGGLWSSARDHARFGLLVHRDGRWADRQLVPAAFLRELRQPCPLNPEYGFLWWLNTGRAPFPSAPASSYLARGAGSSLIWIDPDHDLVVVARWIDKASIDGFLARVLAAVER